MSGLYWKTMGSLGSRPNRRVRTAESSLASLRMATESGVSPAMPISRSVAPYPLKTLRNLLSR